MTLGWGSQVDAGQQAASQAGPELAAAGVDVDRTRPERARGDAGHCCRFAVPPGGDAGRVDGTGANAVASAAVGQAGASLGQVTGVPCRLRQARQLPRGRLLAADSGRICQPGAANPSASRAGSAECRLSGSLQLSGSPNATRRVVYKTAALPAELRRRDSERRSPSLRQAVQTRRSPAYSPITRGCQGLPGGALFCPACTEKHRLTTVGCAEYALKFGMLGSCAG